MGARLSFSDTVVSLTISPMKTECLKEVTEIDTLVSKTKPFGPEKRYLPLGKEEKAPISPTCLSSRSLILCLRLVSHRLSFTRKTFQHLCNARPPKKMKKRWVHCCFSIYRKREMNQKWDGKIQIFKYSEKNGWKKGCFHCSHGPEDFLMNSWTQPHGQLTHMIWGISVYSPPSCFDVSYLLQQVNATAAVPSCPSLTSILILSMLILQSNSHSTVSTSHHFTRIHALLATLGLHVFIPVTIS